MTLSHKELEDLMADFFVKLTRAKAENNKAMIKLYEYEIRLLEVAYD